MSIPHNRDASLRLATHRNAMRLEAALVEAMALQDYDQLERLHVVVDARGVKSVASWTGEAGREGGMIPDRIIEAGASDPDFREALRAIAAGDNPDALAFFAAKSALTRALAALGDGEYLGRDGLVEAEPWRARAEAAEQAIAAFLARRDVAERDHRVSGLRQVLDARLRPVGDTPRPEPTEREGD